MDKTQSLSSYSLLHSPVDHYEAENALGQGLSSYDTLYALNMLCVAIAAADR
jgi:hypothetical protein